MADLNGAGNPDASAVQTEQGAPATASATGLPENLQQFVAPTESLPASAPTDGAAPSGQPASDTDESAKHFQRIADQRLAENLRLQQELMEYRAKMTSQPAPQNEANPYDPNTNWPAWIQFENAKTVQKAIEEADRRSEARLMQLVQVAQETQWAQQHPDVDVNAVKAFARVNQIGNLEHAYRLMTYDQTIAAAKQETMRSTMQQFRQPTNQPASPIRGASGAGSPTVGLSFAEMVKAFAENPRVIDSWPDPVKEMFNKELDFRSRQR